jgi:hypothetical protein
LSSTAQTILTGWRVRPVTGLVHPSMAAVMRAIPRFGVLDMENGEEILGECSCSVDLFLVRRAARSAPPSI